MINTIIDQLTPGEASILNEADNMGGALVQYSNIVKVVAEDYTNKTTVKELRDDHPELNFMEDDEIADILNYAKNRRYKEWKR